MIALASSVAIIALSVLPNYSPPGEDDPVLIKLQPKTGSPVVGQLLKETDSDIHLLDLRTGKQVTFGRRDILRSTTNLSDKEAIAVVGLPSFLAWRIKGSLAQDQPKGKIAKVSAGAFHVTLGAKNGIELGQKLVVLRDEGEIKDPDSGKVLGRELVELGRLEVTDVENDFSKAKALGHLKAEIRPGDTVEQLRSQRLIAALPLVNADGDETEGGRKLSEELTTGLVSHGIRLVERTLLDKAVKELTVQQTELFDPASARKVGKQVGAYAVLCGTIVADGRTSQAHVRLIEVETGQILFAGSQNLSGRSSALIRPVKPTQSPNAGRPPIPVRKASDSQREVLKNSIGMGLVRIPSKTIYMGVYEVTQEEYEQVITINPSGFSAGGTFRDKVASLDTRRFPVDQVTLRDAIEFCDRLSASPAEKTARRKYRLPTETEWVHACRAGTTTEYSFGNGASELGKHAWYKNNSDGRAHTVGDLQPNSFGLHDMHGNVWEWCQEPDGRCVYRGGGWSNADVHLGMSVTGDRDDPNKKGDIGFRVVCEIGPE